MADLYSVIETVFIWGLVVFAVGLVIYLGYRQYLKTKYRRARRRRHARRAMRQERSLSRSQSPPDHHPTEPLQQPTKS
jgi:hypothetical protein